MFTIKNPVFVGKDTSGLAVFTTDGKPTADAWEIRPPSTHIDKAKIAKAQADRDLVNKLMGF